MMRRDEPGLTEGAVAVSAPDKQNPGNRRTQGLYGRIDKKNARQDQLTRLIQDRLAKVGEKQPEVVR